MLRGVAEHYEQSLETPYKDLPEDFKQMLLHGSGETEIEFNFWRAGKMSKIKRPFEGVIPNLERLYAESESEFTRNRLKGFHEPAVLRCVRRAALQAGDSGGDAWRVPDANRSAKCRESSTNRQASLTFPGLSIMDVCALSVDGADGFFAELKLTEFQQKIAGEIIKEIRARLGFLNNVGLGYLTLNRESGTLERRRSATDSAGDANRRGTGRRALYSG